MVWAKTTPLMTTPPDHAKTLPAEFTAWGKGLVDNLQVSYYPNMYAMRIWAPTYEGQPAGQAEITPTMKFILHGLLFVLAILVFYVGLGIGLQVNPTLGTALWLVAAAIGGLNLLWIIRSRR